MKNRARLIPNMTMLFIISVVVLLPVTVFGIDKMTVSIGAQDIHSTPEWQEFEKLNNIKVQS